jgi:hypothetical protein
MKLSFKPQLCQYIAATAPYCPKVNNNCQDTSLWSFESPSRTDKQTTTMATTEKYTIVRNLSYQRVLVKRLSDGENFVGQEWDIDLEPPENHANLLGPDGPFLAATNVLNHPNLLSFHTEVVTSPIVGSDTVSTAATRYLVWDRCDAGTLTNLLADPPVKPVSWGFLPEGLVWHVMIDMLRALQWCEYLG